MVLSLLLSFCFVFFFPTPFSFFYSIYFLLSFFHLACLLLDDGRIEYSFLPCLHFFFRHFEKRKSMVEIVLPSWINLILPGRMKRYIELLVRIGRVGNWWYDMD